MTIPARRKFLSLRTFLHSNPPSNLDNGAWGSNRGVAMSSGEYSAAVFHPEPTLLEAELDSISWTLTQMKTKLNREPLLEHLSETERAELAAALHRAQMKMSELGELIGGNA
jgi:hypothetical protein